MSKHILIIDDEILLLQSLKDFIKDAVDAFFDNLDGILEIKQRFLD